MLKTLWKIIRLDGACSTANAFCATLCFHSWQRSGKRLTERSLDIDHCFPWSAWACDDLWNLLPSDRTVNQRQKRDRLPSATRLQAAQDRGQGWWQAAYLQALNPLLPVRFTQEACASLPGLLSIASAPSLDDCFTAILLQQVRLKHDQQVPEWQD